MQSTQAAHPPAVGHLWRVSASVAPASENCVGGGGADALKTSAMHIAMPRLDGLQLGSDVRLQCHAPSRPTAGEAPPPRLTAVSGEVPPKIDICRRSGTASHNLKATRSWQSAKRVNTL